jgi:DNA-binding response OmpR family regulator
VLAAMLTRRGHSVVQARDGAEALTIVRQRPVDVIVLDLLMPNVDGFAVLNELQNTEQRIPVVVVSGGDRSSSEVRALRLGANVYLAKPVDAAALADEVTRLLKRVG